MGELLTTETFKEKVFDYSKNQEWKFGGDRPCIIDFYADWCQPCKIVTPIIDELAEEYKGKINFYKVDTEVQQELASVFGIRSIPALLFCPADKPPQMAVGAIPKETFYKAIQEVLNVERN